MRLSFKPTFICLNTLLIQIPLQLFFTLWSGGFLGGLATSTGLFPKGSNLPFELFGGAAFIGIPLVIYTVKKLSYHQTTYDFYDDRLEFKVGYFTLNKKSVKFKDVKEVTLEVGIFQRFYGLGTIYIATPATGSIWHWSLFSAAGLGTVSAKGIIMRDITNPDEAYLKIKELIDLYN